MVKLSMIAGVKNCDTSGEWGGKMKSLSWIYLSLPPFFRSRSFIGYGEKMDQESSLATTFEAASFDRRTSSVVTMVEKSKFANACSCAGYSR